MNKAKGRGEKRLSFGVHKVIQTYVGDVKSKRFSLSVGFKKSRPVLLIISTVKMNLNAKL